ncbi:DUF302 domain-containing protein [Parasedimentitalea marina]|uniref:DUF302 domain-containing protein n=1 Tax=Parasedimentitalea marina TaxID=2483033 RepID=A0A3T0N169_9RHOB|nr:DUF302 domain-containing protein [Parasedimentitalea marina]AZV77770.1 DUF302 domain-containing protein [Parasedimentitalea marina]
MIFKPFSFVALLALTALPAAGDTIEPRDGWVVIETQKGFDQLITDVKTATKAQGMGVVTQAGPTGAAARRGITIPGNRVIGVFNNDFAVRILASSTAAMIEAPIRFYVTENPGGSATLSYKTPSHVFAPYTNEGGAALVTLAAELNHVFDAIAQQASQ